MGLPAISVALLTATIGLKEAMALMLIPALVTNLWQAKSGQYLIRLLKRFRFMLLCASIVIWFSAGFLSTIEAFWPTILLGISLGVYGLISLLMPHVKIQQQTEPWASPLMGVISGVITGLTGTYFVPGVFYFQSLGLQKEEFIQAMGIFFTVSTVALGIALRGHQMLSQHLALLSFVGLLPALAAMKLGQHLRLGLSNDRYQKIFFISLLLFGLLIVLKTIYRDQL